MSVSPITAQYHPSFNAGSYEIPPPKEAGGHSFALAPDGRFFFDALQHHIGKARKNVDIQFFDFEIGSETMPVIKKLGEVATAGVNVRVMYDHLPLRPNEFVATKRNIGQLEGTPNLAFRAVRSKGSALSRDHKKIVVIDSQLHDGLAYIGGMNFVRRSYEWNDFMVGIKGPAVAELQNDFDRSWDGREQPVTVPLHDADETVFLTDTKHQETINTFAANAIAKAKRRIWLETPYLDVASTGMAMSRAKLSNPELDVKVIVPKYSNYALHRLLDKRLVRSLAESGVETYRYGKNHKRMSHAKLLIVDDMVMFGSSNYTNGPLAGQNSEVEVSTRNQYIVGQLEQWYAEDMAESERVHFEDIPTYGLPERVLNILGVKT